MPRRVPIVVEIYRMIGEQGISSVQCAKVLNARQVPTATMNRGNGHRVHNRTLTELWTAQHVCSVIRNRLFMGERTWGGKVVPCPPIVSPELWAAANAALKRNRHLSKRNAKHVYLLTSLVKCVACGRTYTGLSRTFKTGLEKRWYKCTGYTEAEQGWRPASLCCPVPMLNAAPLEEAVWGLVVEHVSRYEETLTRLAQVNRESRVSGEALSRRQDSLARERQRLEDRRRDILLEDSLTAAETRVALDAIAGRLEEIGQAVHLLDAQAQAGEAHRRQLEYAEAHLKSWANRVAGITDPRLKRHVLQRFVEKVEVVVEQDSVRYLVYLVFGDEPEACSILSNKTRPDCINLTSPLTLVLQVQTDVRPRAPRG